jgi:gluconate 2-dehydrogenase gamma chain
MNSSPWQNRPPEQRVGSRASRPNVAQKASDEGIIAWRTPVCPPTRSPTWMSPPRRSAHEAWRSFSLIPAQAPEYGYEVVVGKVQYAIGAGTVYRDHARLVGAVVERPYGASLRCSDHWLRGDRREKPFTGDCRSLAEHYLIALQNTQYDAHSRLHVLKVERRSVRGGRSMTDRLDPAAKSDSEGLSRRDVLSRGMAFGAVLAVSAAGTVTFGPSIAAAAPTGLSADQRSLLDAIVDRLIPADATSPSGTAMGVSAYIERGLAGGLMGGLSATAPLYEAGLAAIDAYSRSAYRRAFRSLTPAKQDAVLADVEAGKPTSGFVPDAATFFATLHEHSLQGMLCDPAYGGNKGFAGWDLLGFPGVRMPVPAEYQKLGVKVPKAHKSTYSGGDLGSYPTAKKEALA